MATQAIRIAEFDTWREGYGQASVEVLLPGTTARARVFSDPDLTTEVDNPEILIERTVNDHSFGKYDTPRYTGQGYELSIESTDKTGRVQVPVITLVQEDASNAVSRTQRGTRLRELTDRFDDRVYAEDFGDIGNTPATNNATIVKAVGAAAAAGAGRVILPEGSIPYQSLILPRGVVLDGQGRDATSLRSSEAQAVITLGGDRAGLRRLTLDGENLNVGSFGVDAIGINESVFDDVLIRRFDTGMRFRGGRRATWMDLYVDNCVNGVQLHGDANDPTGDGDEYRDNIWKGGEVTSCTGIGLEVSYVDRKARNNVFEKVGFDGNTNDAIVINGARHTRFIGCWWKDNIDNLVLQDDPDTSLNPDNQIVNFKVIDGTFEGGFIRANGLCQDVVFSSTTFEDVDWDLSIPQNPILLVDPIEDSLVTVGGDGTKLQRIRKTEVDGEVVGITTNATPLVAWSIELKPGQIAYAEAKVIARQQGGEGHAVYHIGHRAERPGSELAYDNQTANYAAGLIVTGGTSGATGRIVDDVDAGATGTLTLQDILGDFLDNEIVTDSATGSADANGTLVLQDAVLLGSQVDIITLVETAAGLAATFAVSGGNFQLQVTGIAAQTFEWQVRVSVVVRG